MSDSVIKHAIAVVEGKIIDGTYHKKACERFLSDYERSKEDDFPYEWDAKKAQKVIDFANTLTIGEGMEKKQLTLYPHQCFDLGSLFGWVNKETGFRRYRRSYISMARQNGKSFLNGILGTYIGGFSGYQNGRLFTAATKKRQSKLVWDEMRKFIESDSDLSELFRVQDWKSTITCKVSGNTIEALSKEGGLDEVAREVINGDYGNGEERKRRLREAGFDPDVVQKRVNERL